MEVPSFGVVLARDWILFVKLCERAGAGRGVAALSFPSVFEIGPAPPARAPDGAHLSTTCGPLHHCGTFAKERDGERCEILVESAD